MAGHVVADPGAVVLDLDHDRQFDALPAVRDPQRQPVGVLGRQPDLAALAGHRLRGVLDQVQEHLDQLVAVAVDRGQRGIVALDEADLAPEAALGEAPHVLEHQVDVDRAALDRLAVGELLHVVDQTADPIRLLADQPDQRPLVLGDAALEQLRGAADPRQRVLDLMRQSGGEARHGARAAPIDQLVIEPARDRARVQHHEDVTRHLGHGRDMQIDQARRTTIERQIDAVVRHAVPFLLHAPDQIEQWAVEWQQVIETTAHEHARLAPSICSAAELTNLIRNSPSTTSTLLAMAFRTI